MKKTVGKNAMEADLGPVRCGKVEQLKQALQTRTNNTAFCQTQEGDLGERLSTVYIKQTIPLCTAITDKA